MEAAPSYPASPRWNLDRPFLTGRIYQETRSRSQLPGCKVGAVSDSSRDYNSGNPIGSYASSVQELLIIDDLLSAMAGIEGRFISIRESRGQDGPFTYHVDSSADLVLQELAKRVFPLCENYLIISQFVESRSHFRYGLVNHAFAAALRVIIVNHEATIAQLEHQFRIGRLSLQALWFYCQPNIGPMEALATVVQNVSANQLMGSAVLNLLEWQVAAMAGDNTVRTLLEELIRHVNTAYLSILERWVYEGVIDDPYGEFFIADEKSLKKESLTEDYDSKYWQQRYSLKDDVPTFLANAAGTILTTGKYLNVLRECGHNVQVAVSQTSKLTSVGSNHQYLECIKIAHGFASGELLNLLKQKYDLLGKLRSLKHYFFLDQGDFLVHFMDIARDELAKTSDKISSEKLQSLLDLALRTSVAATDPCHEDLTCFVETSSLFDKLQGLKDLEGMMSNMIGSLDSLDIDRTIKTTAQIAPVRLTGLETFALNFQAQWPLSLVISRKALTKYQLIFRFLFHCTHVSRQLCGAWQLHQGARAVNILGSVVSRSSLLCRSMLKFINSLLHYLTFEVLEPNWHVMHDRFQVAKSLDEVLGHHDLFLEKCLRECLLLLPQLLKRVEKMMLTCLQYSAAVQWLIPSLFMTNDSATMTDSSVLLQKLKPIKRSVSRGRSLKFAPDCPAAIDTVLKFEKEFNSELQNLGSVLSNSSQAEPYLTHLAQLILGEGNDR